MTNTPDMTKPLSQLLQEGTSALSSGDFETAKMCFIFAHEKEPDHQYVNYYLAYIAEQQQDHASAQNHYQKVIALDPPMRQAYVQLARIHQLENHYGAALAVLMQAEQHFPNDREILYLRGKMAAHIIPGWHLPMLADDERNNAYEKAINETIQDGDIVLDIGTGSGLLAMMAVRAGAAHVYACEMEEAMAILAKQVIAQNGLSDKITVINKHSTQLMIGEDLPTRADVLVTEIFDRALVGEGMLPTIIHARSALLKPNAKIIPQGASLRGCFVESPHFHRFHHVAEVNGFDLSAMNVLAHPMAYKDGLINLKQSQGRRLLSDPLEIKRFDFEKLGSLTFRSEAETTIIADGTADAILMWFDLHLSENSHYTTAHVESHNHWRQATQLLLDRPQVQTGQALSITTTYFGYFDFICRIK